MAKVNWTSEQQKVIDLRNRNILVSAAAGSGKTAVLVERIINKITDPVNPVDIDKILVVTFTKAAAAEMRGRISQAIEKKRAENPEDENLERQAVLVHNAQITTIDSFCLFVVRNHFEDIGLDPNFRIADEGEIKLLEMDVLAEVFSRNYERQDNKSFLNLIDAYSDKRSDEAVRDMVSLVYSTSSSDSWPRKWIMGLDGLYRIENPKELENSEFFARIVDRVINQIGEAKSILLNAKELALSPNGLAAYAKTIDDDLFYFDNIQELKDYASVKEFFHRLDMKNLARCSGEVDENKKKRVSETRNGIKKQMAAIKKSYFDIELEQIIEQIGNIRPYVSEIIRLTLEYFDAMEAAKREKRILDFADIEHLALKILVDEDTMETRTAADEFRQQFEEIMIDEYQDSNQVQEDIMCAISRECQGHNNMFMVGDVKQSIYRFRLARPELFMGKYETYSTSDSTNQRIDLYDNFRSRQEVVDFVNDVFFKIMAKDLGNVTYDDDAALHYHASYPDSSGNEPEIILCDMKSEDIGEILEEEDDRKKIEALMVAKRIKELLANGQVTDKESGQLRPVRLSDIVILLRSIRDWGDKFAEVLKDCGISAYVESSTGYFSAYEVQIVLSMLKILDNPYQDIPMAAVLKSAMVGLDDEELAEIAADDSNIPFAHKAIRAMQEGDNERLTRFYEIYRDIRAKLSDTPVHLVIQEILDRTGFGYYAASMPAGKRRAQNLDMLIEKAIAYEQTSYKGLFHFVRYIEQLQKYDVDFGEASSAGEDEDIVRIMTIHKSKGLEFPIVFVSGIGKKFNDSAKRSKLVIHPDLGIGLDEIRTEPKIKIPCLMRQEIINRLEGDDKGEELRVLYVALTRAKEKLILTGVANDGKKLIESKTGNVIPKVPVSFAQRNDAKTFLELLVPALLSYPDKYNLEFVDAGDFARKEAEELASLDINQAELLERINSSSDYLLEQVSKNFDFEYAHLSDVTKKRKYSVSELKHMAMAIRYDEEERNVERPDFAKEEIEAYIPVFAREDKELNKENVNPGALRGTAVHRVMECLDFAAILDIDTSSDSQVTEFVNKQLEYQLKNDMITKDMLDMVSPTMFEIFIKSDIALRMAQADSKGLLFKEKPFVMRAKEGYLVQGIIDVFWFEGQDIVLLDYKTDRVETADELILRYQKQIELYGDALSRIYSNEQNKVRVKEGLLYSFRLKKEIVVNE